MQARSFAIDAHKEGGQPIYLSADDDGRQQIVALL